MNKFLFIIGWGIVGIIMSILVFAWGYYNNGIFRMIIGIVLLLVTISSANQNYIYVVELNSWLDFNQGAIIIFYPTKKVTQEQIRSIFIPLIPFKPMEVYYDGPKLAGDIKRSIVLEIMRWNRKVQVNKPSGLKIVGRNVEFVELSELLNLDVNKHLIESLVERVVRLKAAA
jgi:hypothetical protein